MYCKNCGTEISDDSKFCRKCGTLVAEEQPYPGMYADGGTYVPPPPQKIPSTYFAPTLVLMIVSVVLGLYPAVPFSITAFVLACVARKQYNIRANDQGAKYAKLAKIFMWIGVALMIITVIAAMVFAFNMVQDLMEPLKQIVENYPESEWADRIEDLFEDYMGVYD